MDEPVPSGEDRRIRTFPIPPDFDPLTAHPLCSDSMVILRGGPGRWVAAADGLLAFCTLFLPSSARRTLLARREGNGDIGLRAWAADLQSAGMGRKLQIGLGLVWLLDAALQFQPFMFGPGFVTKIIEPTAVGSPPLIANSVMSAGQLVRHNAVLFNATFATIQLALGLGLIWRRTARAALAGTIGWGLAVWFLGETLGSLFSGSATPITGAPGAALLYAIIAVLLWPHRAGSAGSAGISQVGPSSAGTFQAGSSLAASSMLGRTWSRLVWLGLWGSFSYLVLQAQVRAPGALRTAIGGLATGEPRWLASMDSGVANAVDSGGLVPAVVFAVLFAVIAVGVFVPAMIRPVLILAALTALAIWVLGENFGGILTGTGTDPNTGPLLILLIAAFWPTGLRTATATSRERLEG